MQSTEVRTFLGLLRKTLRPQTLRTLTDVTERRLRSLKSRLRPIEIFSAAWCMIDQCLPAYPCCVHSPVLAFPAAGTLVSPVLDSFRFLPTCCTATVSALHLFPVLCSVFPVSAWFGDSSLHRCVVVNFSRGTNCSISVFDVSPIGDCASNALGVCDSCV